MAKLKRGQRFESVSGSKFAFNDESRRGSNLGSGLKAQVYSLNFTSSAKSLRLSEPKFQRAQSKFKPEDFI